MTVLGETIFAARSGTGGVTAGNAKVSLAADADVNADLGSVQPNVMNHLQTDTDSSDGPLVIGELTRTCISSCLLDDQTS